MKNFNDLTTKDLARIIVEKQPIEILVDYETLEVPALKEMTVEMNEVIINPAVVTPDNFKDYMYNAMLSSALNKNFIIQLLFWHKTNAKIYCKKYDADLYKVRLEF